MSTPGKLFHFTPLHMLCGIQREGLTRGAVPLRFDPPTLARGIQWLTANSSFAQSWCENQVVIKYRRDDVRLTIRFPKPARAALFRWNEVRGMSDVGDVLSAFGDPENWWLYGGRIPPSWIRSVDYNPALFPLNQVVPA